ncbi:MAG: hypothetical protein QXI33_02590 [Candidatus Pacearchaeota archaeon]
MKRTLMNGLISFLIFVPVAYPHYTSYKGKVRDTYYKFTQSQEEDNIIKCLEKTFILNDSIWSDEIEGVLISNYPEYDWKVVIKYDQSNNKLKAEFIVPEHKHNEYIKKFNDAKKLFFYELENTKEVSKVKRRGKKSEKTDKKENDKKEGYFLYRMKDCPRDGWEITIENLEGSCMKPIISIEAPLKDKLMILNIYEKKNRKKL